MQSVFKREIGAKDLNSIWGALTVFCWYWRDSRVLGKRTQSDFFNVTVLAGYQVGCREMEDKQGSQLGQIISKFLLIWLEFGQTPEYRCKNKLWVRLVVCLFLFTFINPCKDILYATTLCQAQCLAYGILSNKMDTAPVLMELDISDKCDEYKKKSALGWSLRINTIPALEEFRIINSLNKMWYVQ